MTYLAASKVSLIISFSDPLSANTSQLYMLKELKMLSSMSHLVYFLILYSLATLTIALSLDSDISDTLFTRDDCGSTRGSCDNCWATNFPDLGYGICKKGQWQGCQCELSCTGTNDYCNTHGCDGFNDPSGGLGTCTGGTYEGCPCLSICNGELENCNDNGCQGVNHIGGALGTCTAGDFKGCACNSICWDHDGDCGSNGCNGLNNVCQSGDYKGCPCGTQCGNLVSQPCDQFGCAGINNPAMGIGICTAGTYVGCECQLTCVQGLWCNDPECWGDDTGTCTSGKYNGCSCA